MTPAPILLALAILPIESNRPRAETLSSHPIRLETNLAAEMRDGVRLRADVLRPAAPGKFPVILYRTPYGKEGVREDDPFAIRAAKAGYVVVIQDVRGRYASEGTFGPYRQEGEDGWDSVEWAARLPYADGKVGMAGLSYPGAVQWLAAREGPPHLKAIAPAMCFSSGRRFFYFGGAFDLSWLGWFYRNIAPDLRRRSGIEGPTTYAEANAMWQLHKEDWLWFLPLADQPALQGIAPDYYQWLEHPDDGDFWSFADIASSYESIRIPALNVSGWHDEGYGPWGAVDGFNGTRRQGSRLVLGPWTHGTPRLHRTREGELDFGVNAGLDYHELLLRWFDRWLKGIDNGIDREAPVRLFIMGENAWRDEEEFPLSRAVSTPFYLRAGGRLETTPPREGETPDAYDYDPRSPLVDPHGGVQGPFDQSRHESRPDLLAYTSAVLETDLEVTGPIEVELWASSSARDTDFVVRLLDVHPDGQAYNLMSPTLEVLRARYRKSESEPEWLEPGRVELFRLRNGITANLFKAGHRIRVQVVSSFFPHIDRNLNTDADFGSTRNSEVARQKIFHDADHPSRVLLPIVPR